MFERIYHIGYLTDDIDAARRMYETVFDARFKLESEDAQKTMRMVFLRVGETEVELMQPYDPARLGGRTGLILDHIGYVVEDMEAAIATLRERGITFIGEAPITNAEGARVFYLEPGGTLGTRLHLTTAPKA